jgi:imidazolonepropionase-like amidohydrolase/Tol biopolymer transport system component
LRLFSGGLALLLAASGLAASATGKPISAASAVPAPAAAADPAKSGKWDVANPAGDSWGWSDITLDTDEGTWMSLDVSPDGKTVVFDMLGDLHTMPIGGSADGSAVTCIASGRQWDMQPRFSPDGRMIAFVSDRSGDNGKGGDNIWVMDTDGKGGWLPPRQITKESFRLLTQPVFTADSQYIIARKHFTSRRSLGSGEMWMYHASGKTDGLQLTNKPSEQKDVGEPAVSPDGKYMYYSLDATGGSTFEYDKDGNSGIYAIDRLDLTTRETTRLIAGPGGACRPVPSPDGKSIAFIRRVRYQSTLFVMDLASGQTRAVYGSMERDNQETWAVHGVYPNFAWTADGKAIIAWAGGKIRNIGVADGKAEVIPFRIRGTRSIAKSQRVAYEAMPEQFDIKLLRDVSVSPTGDKALFQALGRIYVRELAAPSGSQPRRLTSQNDHFEFFPSWSRDGKFIVYATWNDKELGSVRIIPADGASGAAGTSVTTEPGHYNDPVLSPDGKRVVYLKTSGGYLTSPLWSRETGVYSAPNPLLATGRPVTDGTKLLSRRGSNPQFGAGSDRVFLTQREGGSDSDRASLVSVPMVGVTPDNPERTHFRNDWATEYKVSPTGKYISFVERFNVYVAPFLETGRPIDLSPKSTTLPLAKVSTQAGNFIHWSADSKRLHWVMGPELLTQPVEVALGAAGFGAVVPPAADAAKPAATLPAPTAINLSFKFAADVPKRGEGGKNVIALTNARIVTMETGTEPAAARGGMVIGSGTILVEGNRISAVGSTGQVVVPGDAQVFDLKGATVTPGFIDVHAHGSQGETGMTPQRNWISHANIAFGVTTIHDPSNDTEMIFAASELQKAGMILSPRTFSTGTILYGAAGAFKAEIDSLEDALFHLRRYKAVGGFSVKSYNQPRRDQRQMVMEAARQLGMLVVPEGGAVFQHNMTMVVDGHSSVEHTVPVANIYNDVAQLWGPSQTGYTPTLGVAYGGMGGENYWYAKTNVWENQRLMNFVPRYVVDPRSRRRTDAPDEEWNHIKQAAVAKRVLDAKTAAGNPGGGPTMGAHGQLAGLAAHWEMWMFVQGGMTPFEALRAATIDGAWYIGMDRDLGSIKAGKLADLVIFTGDPLADIRKSEDIGMVMLNGRLYEGKTLAQLAPQQAPGPKMFFESLQRGAGTPMAIEAIMRHAATCAGCQYGHQ